MKLPTGEKIGYIYTGGDTGKGVFCADASTSGIIRATPDGVWNYTRSNVVPAGPAINTITSSTTTVTDPLGNQTVIDFAGGISGLFEMQRRVYNGGATGTPVETTITCYNGQSPTSSCTNPSIAAAGPNPTELNIYRSLNGGPQSRVDTFYNTYHQVTEKDEYDFGATAPTRKTLTTYDTTLGPNINDHPSTVKVTDGSGNLLAETDYTYDEDISSLQSSGSVQLHAVSCSGKCRGNLTTLTKRVNGSTTISEKFTHYDNGLVYQATDANLNVKTYTYGACGDSFLTNIAFPLSLSESYTWDCNGGVVTQAKDFNKQPTNYIYNDPLWRVTEIDYPDNGKSTATYNDTANPPNMVKGQLVTSGLSIQSQTNFDGYGRPVTQMLTSDPEGTDFTDTTYNGLGLVLTKSNPHRTTSSTTDGTTKYSYDALGRVTQVNHPDGSVSKTSYSGNTTTVTDEVGNPRMTYTDGLGRVFRVDEPGPPVPTDATGSVTINGTLQTIASTPGTPGSGSVTITGEELKIPDPNGPACPPKCSWIYDHGTVSITVQSFTAATIYGQGSTTATIASSLAGTLNGASSPVTASLSGSTITLTAKQNGVSTNYSLSGASQTGDPTDFPGPSFHANPTGPTLTGGTNPTPTIYDSGTVSIAVNGVTSTTSYGQGSTPSTVASGLVTAINGNSSSPVTASASGSTVNLTSSTGGPSSNYPLSASSATSQSAYFSQPSFSGTTSGLSLTGGGYVNSFANGFTTLYFYDALNNLLCVEQHGNVSGTGCSSPPSSDSTSPWRVRRFTYDSLSRLLSASNPESGAISYTYDNNGNVRTKTGPKANPGATGQTTINYTYDALNRLTQKSSTNPATLVWKYGYDGGALTGCGQNPPSITGATNLLGRRSAMCASNSASSWSYDSMGRPAVETRVNQSIGEQPKYSVGYTYNLDGSLWKLTYPSGDVVTYTVGGAGRPLGVADSSNAYAASATYAPHGALAGVMNGTGIVTANFYNDRLQPTLLSAAVNGNAIFSLCFDFHLGVPVHSGPNCNINAYTVETTATFSTL